MKSLSKMNIIAGLIALSPSSLQAASATPPAVFEGAFSQQNTRGEGCSDIFSTLAYNTRFSLTGSARRTSILHFVPTEEASSFFSGMTFVGLYGGSGDVTYEKTVTVESANFAIRAEGLADPDVIYLQVRVHRLNEINELVCEAAAEYTAYRKTTL